MTCNHIDHTFREMKCEGGLYAWGSTLLDLPKEATLPILAFLGIMFAAMAFALYQTKRKNIW